jgi:hypothetical protein
LPYAALTLGGSGRPHRRPGAAACAPLPRLQSGDDELGIIIGAQGHGRGKSVSHSEMRGAHERKGGCGSLGMHTRASQNGD